MARCIPPGMPRMMINYGLGMEFVLTPDTTFLLFGEPMRQLRRIFTDGRGWPAAITPSFSGYSIGRWDGDDGHGHASELVVETRGMRGPRSYDSSGAPFHVDNQTIVEEHMHLDAAKPDVLCDDMTVEDHALTRPWTITKRYRRDDNPVRLEYDCSENNHHVLIGGQDYFLSGDDMLMPSKVGQAPPDLHYFDKPKR